MALYHPRIIVINTKYGQNNAFSPQRQFVFTKHMFTVVYRYQSKGNILYVYMPDLQLMENLCYHARLNWVSSQRPLFDLCRSNIHEEMISHNRLIGDVSLKKAFGHDKMLDYVNDNYRPGLSLPNMLTSSDCDFCRRYSGIQVPASTNTNYNISPPLAQLLSTSSVFIGVVFWYHKCF